MLFSGFSSPLVLTRYVHHVLLHGASGSVV